jgi:1-acyl-sn-glycerol-3-phosphate acyltransferase
MTQKFTLPTLGDQTPQRGTKTSRRFWASLLQLKGWRVVGEVPNVPKAVLIALPHTSNEDGFIGVGICMALGLDLHIMIKDAIYKPPARKFLDWVGMIPVDRNAANGLVEQTCDVFNSRDNVWIGIAPEGTRHTAEGLKSGFYRIAYAAGVPIVLYGYDYDHKLGKFLGLFQPTGDFDADLPQILAFYTETSPADPTRLSIPMRAVLKR